MGVPGVPMVHWDRMDTWDCSVGLMGQIDIPWESQVYQWYIGTGWTHRIAVWALWDRETSHGSPRCTNGTLGQDGHIGLQCGPYGTDRYPMGVPGVPMVHWGRHMGLQCRP